MAVQHGTDGNGPIFALADLINRQTVRARAEVTGWEDAVDQAGAILVEAGKIDPGYITAMKQVLNELGPYAVIAPGIVLLHARPEDGVRQACLGLVTLSTPVRFGHPENDPVDLVFTLGALDKQSHILALQQLAQKLGDPDFLARLRAANDEGEIIQAFDGNSPS